MYKKVVRQCATPGCEELGKYKWCAACAKANHLAHKKDWMKRNPDYHTKKAKEWHDNFKRIHGMSYFRFTTQELRKKVA